MSCFVHQVSLFAQGWQLDISQALLLFTPVQIAEYALML